MMILGFFVINVVQLLGFSVVIKICRSDQPKWDKIEIIYCTGHGCKKAQCVNGSWLVGMGWMLISFV